MRDNERGPYDDDQAQYRNDTEPAAMVALLRSLVKHASLSAEYTALLLRWMSESPTGAERIKDQLPPSTVVAHKTGTSDEKNGRIYESLGFCREKEIGLGQGELANAFSVFAKRLDRRRIASRLAAGRLHPANRRLN